MIIKFHDGDKPIALPVLLFMLPLLPPILLYIRKRRKGKRGRGKQKRKEWPNSWLKLVKKSGYGPLALDERIVMQMSEWLWPYWPSLS